MAGLLAALGYLWRRFSTLPPLASVLRIGVAAALAIALGRVIPGNGKIAGLAAMAAAGLVFVVALLLLREFSVMDKEKFAKILKLGKRS